MNDIDKIITLKDAFALAEAHLGYQRPQNFKYVFHLTEEQFRQAALDANLVLSKGAKRFLIEFLDMKLEFSCVDEDFNKKPSAIFGD